MDEKTTALLKSVGDVPEGQYFALPKNMKKLEDDGLVEGNKALTNPKDKNQIAYRLTEKGKTEVNGAGDEEPDAFVIADVPLPPIGRINSGPSKYPFDRLAQGQAFFIPAPANMKSPSKSFGSMVSSANKKYGNPNGDFRHFTTRSMTGDSFGKPGVKGVGIFRLAADEEAKAKAKASK